MKPTVIVNEKMLHDFGACRQAREQFVAANPNGFDVGGLYGTDEEAALVWAVLFASEWKEHIGWAIGVGLLPAKIRGDLCGADLCEANLRGANLYRADLREANLRGANLWGANLRRAALYRANLHGADLCVANLCVANLRGANLYGAALCETDLRGADLCGANLREALWDEETCWPEGFTPPTGMGERHD